MSGSEIAVKTTLIIDGEIVYPDIYFGISENTERRIVRAYEKTGVVTRCSAEEWFGQDNPNYGIHHWNLTRR